MLPIWGFFVIIYFIALILLFVSFLIYNGIKDIWKPDRTANDEIENIELRSCDETNKSEGSAMSQLLYELNIC